MRTDKKKNIDKVAAALAVNPLATEREIADMTDVSKSAVNRAKEEAGQAGAKDDRIKTLTDKDYDLTLAVVELQAKRLEDTPEKINNSDLNRWGETSAKRYSIFKGDITDDQGGLRKYEDLPDDKLNDIIATGLKDIA